LIILINKEIFVNSKSIYFLECLY